MKIKLIVTSLSLCLTLFSQVIAQPKIDSARAESYLIKASINFSAGNYDSAQVNYSKALELQKVIYGELHLNVASTYMSMGRTAWTKNGYNLALEYFHHALEIRKNQLGENHVDVATVYNALGIVSWSIGLHDEAFGFYEKTLKILKRTLGDSHPKVGGTLHNIGILLMESGAYRQALDYIESSLLIKNNGNEEYSSPLDIAPGLHVISIIYRKMGDRKLALQYGQSAIDMLISDDGYEKQTLADFRLSLGMVYIEGGEMTKAKEYFDKALETYLDLFGEEHSGTAVVYHNLGMSTDDYKQKLRYLNKALEIRLKVLDSDHEDVTYIYNTIGESHLEEKDYKRAVTSFSQGISANIKNNRESSNTKSNYLTEYADQIPLLEALVGRAKAFRALYASEGEMKDLQSALTNIQIADTLLNQIYRTYLNHEDKILLAKTRRDIYSNAIDLSISLSKKNLFDASQVFRYSEKNKGIMLNESNNSISAKKLKLIPDTLLSIEEKLKADISLYKSHLTQNNKQITEQEGFKKKLFVLNRKYDSLILSFEQNYPNYFQLKYSNKTASIEEIQSQTLEGNQALIEYFLADSSLYIFAITKNNYEVKKVAIDSIFHSHFDRIRKQLQSPKLTNQTKDDFNSYTISAHALYQYLLAPIADLIKEKDLIIVPDDKLALIPFETLLTENPNSQKIDYKTLPYVLRSHTVSYANSATTLLNNLESIDSHTNNTGVLSFAPSFEQQFVALAKPDTVRSSLGPLSWTEKEVNGLMSHFDGDKYIGKRATEKVFKENTNKYNIIHIASHGLVDDENPMYSKIAFTLDEKDKLNDGYLHTFELYNMQLNAAMVVLSACNTGYGKVQKGEGVMSLGYAFAYAGVPSVVMSHWQVDDKSTYLLMNNFYKYLADGMTKSEALRKAKLALLENENMAYANPYYWGAFVVYGDDSPIEDVQSKWIWYVTSLLVLLFLTFLYFKKAR